jgi:superoxide oxidase
MRNDVNAQRYPTIGILLHWCTAFLVVGAYVLSEDATEFGNAPPMLHFSWGMAAFASAVARLAMRPLSAMPPAESTWRWAWVAKAAHAILYLLLIAVPLSGWYALSRMGLSVSIFGWHVPALATHTMDNAPGAVGTMHQLGGHFLLLLAASHAGTALWHQFVRKDKILQRMNPF